MTIAMRVCRKINHHSGDWRIRLVEAMPGSHAFFFVSKMDHVLEINVFEVLAGLHRLRRPYGSCIMQCTRGCQEKVKENDSSTVPPARCCSKVEVEMVPSFTTSTTTKFRNPEEVMTGPKKPTQETFLESMTATLGMMVSYDFCSWWISDFILP